MPALLIFIEVLLLAIARIFFSKLSSIHTINGVLRKPIARKRYFTFEVVFAGLGEMVIDGLSSSFILLPRFAFICLSLK